MQYSLNQSASALDYPDFDHPFLLGMKAATPYFWVVRYIPMLGSLLANPPQWLVKYLPPSTLGIFELRQQILEQLDDVLSSRHESSSGPPSHEIIFHHLLSSDDTHKSPPLNRVQLLQEAMSLMMAGSDTVGITSTVGFVHILSNPDVYRRIIQELDEAWPDTSLPITLVTLEKLPYLVRKRVASVVSTSLTWKVP